MRTRLALAALAVLLLAGCATLRELATIDRPTAEVESVRIESLSFTDVGLLANIAVENPNPIGISMAGFSYSLSIEGERVIGGDLPRGLEVASFGRSVVELPVVLAYETILNTVTGLRGRSEAAYEITAELRFDLPVIGRVTLPVRNEGTIPIVRPPSVRVSGLRLSSIGITGAELSLTVAVENPNSFSFGLDALEFSFEVQDRQWAAGGLDRPARIAALAEQELTFGFRLLFTEFGRTVRDLLLGDDEISYVFAARAAIDPDLELLPPVELPYERSGTIPLRRN